ncbi:hypothetical protein [Limimaricola hongkongensis]|uniref:Uncharacterized protein n=1 Tax=Limimaricola hongkongensis DSM 17492 TaxID=1122180 RepID=A0A017HHX9_9RHOB|nr:hypothetical protein [Limimaricola hongkongensis]EYD73399.1 hypothetical protein Lokhon_00930 [Limimaricola hongkongensis DSM 17492]
MADKPRSSRRALIYVMIPMGFILLVILLVLGGWFRAEEAEDFDTAPLEVPGQAPADTGETGDAELDDAVIDDAATDAAEPQTPDVEVRPNVADSDADTAGELEAEPNTEADIDVSPAAEDAPEPEILLDPEDEAEAR